MKKLSFFSLIILIGCTSMPNRAPAAGSGFKAPATIELLKYENGTATYRVGDCFGADFEFRTGVEFLLLEDAQTAVYTAQLHLETKSDGCYAINYREVTLNIDQEVEAAAKAQGLGKNSKYLQIELKSIPYSNEINLKK